VPAAKIGASSGRPTVKVAGDGWVEVSTTAAAARTSKAAACAACATAYGP
jgi:hypothetical protein